MKPNQKLEHNVEPKAERPEEASPRTNPVRGNSFRETFLTRTSVVASGQAAQDLDGVPREPRDDEEYVMKEFEKHVDHCTKRTPNKLREEGYGDGHTCQKHAFDVIQYLCCVNGEANSLTDLSQVSISTERKAAKIEETQKYIDEVKERCKSRAGRQDSAADPKPGEQWQLGE
ncbi:hypothetical protein BDV32DRAFT_146773 [Aspergillus pseudonomiae]|uniref:Uncharacterized protein n=1 Tax=Aspergillus pseudonomiae TaxID=1506151 RepID=A0A5N6IC77_9EURO|nr:uncharacterized protein BDV37DRAFT_277634 [Aspergillus pseudonomiae]KAB8263449.1 hypothetical protein BDV32DRAFT_146773 [Aspergillus pseudonomiae]KAE8409988.1 hypothetical protein BDV37DRAFT_277634 [Aspergillus pseudonomiae]